MGNTPLHSKRRLSGDMESISCDNTPPHIAVDIPAKRPTLAEHGVYPRSAPVDYGFQNMLNNDVTPGGHLAVDNMTWLLHGASLQDGSAGGEFSYATQTRPTSHLVNQNSRPSASATEIAWPVGASLCTDVEMTPTTSADNAFPPQPPANQKKLPTVFRWNGGGHEIYISGTFNQWSSRIPMVRRNSGACVIVDCPPGKHEYKFFIDGAWYHDPTKPTTENQYGTRNNIVEVKQSDFNFLNALEHDIANSKHKAESSPNSDTESKTPPGEYGCFIPDQPQDVYTHQNMNQPNGSAVSPRRSYHNPPAPGVGSISQPPLIPPQLLQGILNKDVGIHCDPNLLPSPNHVMVNHLYALSIKDGVIVLSVITRYRQKFVSTLFYKPIPN